MNPTATKAQEVQTVLLNILKLTIEQLKFNIEYENYLNIEKLNNDNFNNLTIEELNLNSKYFKYIEQLILFNEFILKFFSQYIVYNTMENKATQNGNNSNGSNSSNSSNSLNINFINCSLDTFYLGEPEPKQEKQQQEQNNLLCIICKEEATNKYKNNISFGYCALCFKNHLEEAKEHFIYNLITEDFNFMKPYINYGIINKLVDKIGRAHV